MPPGRSTESATPSSSSCSSPPGGSGSSGGRTGPASSGWPTTRTRPPLTREPRRRRWHAGRSRYRIRTAETSRGWRRRWVWRSAEPCDPRGRGIRPGGDPNLTLPGLVGAIGSGQTKEPGQAGWTPLPLIRDDQALGSRADADGSGAEAAAAMAGGALAAVGQADPAVNSGDTSALDPDFFRNISLGDDPAVGQDRPDVPLGDTPDPNDPADPTDTDPNADGGGDGTDGEGLNPAGEAVGVEEEGPDADGVAADPGSEIGGALVADGAEVQAAQGAGQAILQENTNPPQVPPPPPANDSVVGTYSGSLTAVFDPDIGASVPISGPLALSISQQSA